MKVEIDGGDATYKSTVVKLLREKFAAIEFRDRGLMTKLTDIHPDQWPVDVDSAHETNTVYVILEAEISVCLDRIQKRFIETGVPIDEKYETYDSLFKYQQRFRRLAIKYQTYFIDTTNKTSVQVVEIIARILTPPTAPKVEPLSDRPKAYHKTKTETILVWHSVGIGKIAIPYDARTPHQYMLPNPDYVNQDQFNSYPLIAEGESKIVRQLNDKFSLIQYKPTIYSHTAQRAGIIPGSEIERMTMTRDILSILETHAIPHAYWYVGDRYILCERLRTIADRENLAQIPPIETIVKQYYVGTDAHIYYGLYSQLCNTSAKEEITSLQTLCSQTTPAQRFCALKYPHPLVRFDWRNPNKHPLTKTPLGDAVMSDDHANLFINTKTAKELAKKTFAVLETHFTNMGIQLQDICFMITTNGTMHFGEISQDNARYKKISFDTSQRDLDKDLWRSGNSSDLVLQKWRELTKIVHNYTIILWLSA